MTRGAAVRWALAALALLVALLLLPPVANRFVAGQVRHAANERGFDAHWRRLRLVTPLRARFEGLCVLRVSAQDTVLTVDSLVVDIALHSLLAFHPRPAALTMTHARAHVGGHGEAAADTLEDDAAAAAPGTQDPRRLERVRRSARSLARLLARSARELPRISLTDVTLLPAPGADQLWAGVRIERLEHLPGRLESRLSLRGAMLGEREVPFAATFTRRSDLRIRGSARFLIPDRDGTAASRLEIGLDGALAVDRGHHVLTVVDTTRVMLGALPLRVGGSLAENGPRLSVSLAANGVTQDQVERSLPPAVLGPLRELAVAGSWDYRLGLDLDLARPDSVRFAADVIPHGLALDPARTTLPILALDGPFVAHIHLPKNRIVDRELSPANPHFRTLDEISPALVSAVVTNEDGGFFRHRGFNTDAVRGAIAENVKTASFRRGAGTITMQLARNLWLGHERTLSRKGQEVVLAWVLEHLTGLSKERLLEIYLNIIEWGPDVHGADEAARYYFDRDARDVDVDQALFLATVVPAPSKWRWRFDRDGNLRGSVRAQMHFIGRAMVAKGWLAPEELPAKDDLRIELTGPARAVVFPADSLAPSPSPEPKARTRTAKWLWGAREP
jgi:hypothetical protein